MFPGAHIKPSVRRPTPPPCSFGVLENPNTPKRRKELITTIAAGKSFSLASNVQGQLFAWGKGWMGELGLGKDKDFRVREMSHHCGG